MVAIEEPRDGAHTWALHYLYEQIDARRPYREAAVLAVEACREQDCLEEIADTITLQGFIYLARQYLHQRRHTARAAMRDRVRADAPITIEPGEPIVTMTKRLAVVERKYRTVLDWEFMVPGVGKVVLGEMTRGMIAYEKMLYYDHSQSNGRWHKFFAQVHRGMKKAGEAATVAEVIGEEAVCEIAQACGLLGE